MDLWSSSATAIMQEQTILERHEWRWGEYYVNVYYARNDPRGEEWIANLWLMSRFVDVISLVIPKRQTHRSLTDGYYYQR